MKLTSKRAFTLIELMIVIAIIAIIAAIAIPNLIEARKHGNESAAIGSLKAISSAQSLFREGDKDGNGVLDYGTLTQLSQQNLVDSVLGAGTKQGYNFASGNAVASAINFTWAARGVPAVEGTTGDRRFYTNQTGVIFYTTTVGFTPPLTTADPTNMLPVGQ